MKLALGTLTAALLVTLVAAPQAGHAAGHKSFAKFFSRQAHESGIVRLAVLPFVPVDGSDAREGRYMAERLTMALAERKGPAVVERSLMSKVMSEHFLGKSGALERGKLARIGLLLQAEAVVTGTFVVSGNSVLIQARLVRIDTGVVLAAREGRIAREGFFAANSVFPAPEAITAEEAGREALAFQREEGVALVQAPEAPGLLAFLPETDDLRDAPAGDRCMDYSSRVNELQESILGLKARYWAGELRKKGFSVDAVDVKPGKLISDPKLRLRFYYMLQHAYAQRLPALNEAEVRRYVSADREAFMLMAECGRAS